jgi:hypothetical protein
MANIDLEIVPVDTLCHSFLALLEHLYTICKCKLHFVSTSETQGSSRVLINNINAFNFVVARACDE